MRENYTLPRLHVWPQLEEGLQITLQPDQAHYLKTVLRKSIGDTVRLFNGISGEWLAEIMTVSKREVILTTLQRLREPALSPELYLFFAPVRKHRTAFIIEKGTELGVRRFQPVITERTQFRNFNAAKASLQAREAAEQTERLDVPGVEEVEVLFDLLEAWANYPILFADEAGDARPAQEVCSLHKEAVGILIGPEGGFTDAERETLRAMPNVHPVTLGPRILRADTAAIALLSVWQSVSGDW